MLIARVCHRYTSLLTAVNERNFCLPVVCFLFSNIFLFFFQQCVKSLGARDSNILQELAKQKFKKIVSSTEILEEIDNTFIKS